MNALLPAFWQTADAWIANIGWASLVACVAIAAAWAIARWCTFLSPRVVCWIWRLACLKVLLALVWIQPVDLALLPADPDPLVAAQPIPAVATGWVDGAHSEGHLDGFTAEPGVAAEAGPSFSRLAALLFAAWLIGVLYCVARTARQWGLVRRAAIFEPIARVRSCAASWPAGKSAARRPSIAADYDSPDASKVRCWSAIWRPTIILPDRVEEKFGEAELRLMIAHELAHLKRHDLAWNWLPTVAGWLFFFHPLVWVMIRLWSEAQEAACDELVIQQGVAQPTDYGRLLLKLSACSPFESSAALGAAGVLGAYRNLERRILTMTRVKPFSARRSMAAAGLLVVAAAVTIVPWRLVAAEPNPTARTRARPKPKRQMPLTPKPQSQRTSRQSSTSCHLGQKSPPYSSPIASSHRKPGPIQSPTGQSSGSKNWGPCRRRWNTEGFPSAFNRAGRERLPI